MKWRGQWLAAGMAVLFIALLAGCGGTEPTSIPTNGAATFALTGAAAQPLSVSDSVHSLQVGLAGSIEADLLTADLTGDGEEEVLVGTSRGLYILSRGDLLQYIPTAGPVMDMALLDDLTGNAHRAVAVAVGDTQFPNIRVYDTITGEKVWQFAPRQEVFIENLMWTHQQTLTFDVETADVNGNGVLDVLATSGYRVYAIDGTDGSELWRFEASNNLWRVTVTPDLDGDGVPDLAVGGQSGFMHVISGRDGDLLWEKRIAERYDVINDTGGVFATVERGVWDILPVSILGAPRAVVSSEDGYARLVDLRDGTVHWELQVIEPMEALLFRYYKDTGGNPTSPGDFHFFNLGLSLVPDVTGDQVEEVLASAYLGRRSGQQGQEPRGAGLFLINPATGRTLWRSTSVSLENVARMEVAAWEGGPSCCPPGTSRLST